MDEDEIMVGDHVSVWDGNPLSLQRCIEVKGILDGEVYYDIEDDEGKPLRVHDSVKHCHPIELREEDLDRYGWGFFDLTVTLNNYEHESTKYMWPLFITVDDKRIKVEYVHQLQHLMKICKKYEKGGRRTN